MCSLTKSKINQIRRLSSFVPRIIYNSSHLEHPSYTAKFRRKEEKNSNYIRKLTTAGNVTEDFEVKSFTDNEDHSESLKFEIKTLIYSETDELMQSLNQCADLEQLHQLICRQGSNFQLQHRVQSILILGLLGQQNVERNESINETLVSDILVGLESHLSALNMNELCCCYLYLRKLNVPNTQPVFRDLLLNALRKINDGNELIPLSALSRLSIAVDIGHDFYTPMVCASFLPHTIVHMENCETAETARLLAICLHNLHQLIDEEILSRFKTRIQELLNTNILNAQTTKHIMKLLHFFNMPNWSHRNAIIIRNLLLALKPTLDEFHEQEIKIISRIFQHHLEPAALEPHLKEALEKELENAYATDTLACYMPFTKPNKRNHLINEFKKLLKSPEQWQTPYADINFFTILRALKISDIAVCDEYWNAIYENLEKYEIEEKIQHRFLRHLHRYMHFNNNLGGTYRFLPIERKLSEMSMNAIEYDLAGSIPWKFSRLSSFVFAYGHTPYNWKKFPNNLLSKIISMADQFTATDCFYISRGVQICLEMRFRYEVPSTLKMQLATIDSILLGCVDRNLQSIDNASIQNLNTLVRTLNNRKTLKNSLVYQQAMNKYKTLDYTNLNSRTLRDLAYIFSAAHYIEPKALDAMFNYIEKEHDHILGDTVEKVLTCAYNLGYVPDKFEVLDRAAQVILRDFDLMSGLSIVQCCLALCYYKTIPEELINKVFCVKFIKRIEDEIHLCYSKATYPERVLNQVMQLNRTVCLDFPELNVPWFQQNYIEAQLSKKPIARHKFNDEVQNMLSSLLKDNNLFRCNHTTPYGYQIDFVIHFDHQRKPIAAPVETTMLDRITKVAILLMKLDSYCENDLTSLRGAEDLKTKHLEMMGYKVLHLNEHDWNSKYMKVPGAKTNYLKCLLQISS